VIPRGPSLLERLATARRDGGLTLRADRNALLRSVLRNLGHLLNTRPGSAAAQMDLGVPSPYEMLHAFPVGVDALASAITSCITRFEPRLSDPVVTFAGPDHGDQVLRFTISARLGDEAVALSTDVQSDGRLRVQQ